MTSTAEVRTTRDVVMRAARAKSRPITIGHYVYKHK